MSSSLGGSFINGTNVDELFPSFSNFVLLVLTLALWLQSNSHTPFFLCLVQWFEWMMQASNKNLGWSSLNVSTVSLSTISTWKHAFALVRYFITLKTLNVTSSSYKQKVNLPYCTSINILPVARKGRPKIRGTSLS